MPYLSKSIAVFLSARDLGKAEKTIAREAAEYLAMSGHKVYYGGGYSGLMGVFARAFERCSTALYGVSTLHLKDTEAQEHNAGNTIFVESMSTRKEIQLHHVNKVLVLPGGFGTMDELFETLVLNQLGIIRTKIFIYDPDLRPAFETFLKVMVKRGTINKDEAEKIEFINSIDQMKIYFEYL